MFVLAITTAVLVRYYLLQREAINAVAIQLRDDVVTDFQTLSGALFAAGRRVRDFYNTYSPKVVDAYNRVASEVADRFSK